MIEQAIRDSLQQLGVDAVRRALPALDTTGTLCAYHSCFFCYALHGREVQVGSKEHQQAREFADSFGQSGRILSGLHYAGTPAQAQMLREEVMIFLAEHGDATNPYVAEAELAHA